MVHDFQKKIVFPENILIIKGSLGGFIQVLIEDQFGNFPCQTSGSGDKAFAVLFQNGKVNPRFVVEPVQVSHGNQFHQIFITFLVFGKQYQVIIAGFPVLNFAVGEFIGGDVHLASDDGLNFIFRGFQKEFRRSEEVAVIGESNGLHVVFLSFFKQVGSFGNSVAQGIVRVDMEMDKR
jgi:hypothetical protein